MKAIGSSRATLLATLAAVIVSVGAGEQPARAAALEVAWISSTNPAAAGLGTSSITASTGDVLTADAVLVVDVSECLDTYQLSIDTDAAEVSSVSAANSPGFSVGSVPYSQGSPEVPHFEDAFGALFFGQLAGPEIGGLGTITLTVEAPVGDTEFDVSVGAIGVLDEALCNSGPLPITTGHLTIDVGPDTTFSVDSVVDAVDATPGDGICASASAECTLRAAVMEANVLPGAATIIVPADTYLLTIAGTGPSPSTGDLDVFDDLLVLGAGADCTTGTVITETTSTSEGVFSVHAGAVEIQSVCLTGSSRGLTAIGGRLSLHDFALDGNTYGFRSSAGGNAVLRSGSIAGNGGGSLGGGVYNQGILHLDQVRVENNSSTATTGIGDGHGGVGNASGTLVITNSSISGNTAKSASAIHNLAELVLSNVSIFGNTAVDNPIFWGTIYNSGLATADLTNVTIDGNSFGAVSILGGGGITARNTIVSETAGCAVPLVSAGHNRESGTSCGFTGTGDLQNVGIAFTTDTSGPTPTRVPTSGTNVQDLGDNTQCPHMDQRGHFRPENGLCDIGAAELSSAVACANGLDDDGDGLIDLLDPGCADASDPQELNLVVGDVLVGDDGLMRLDPTTGDVRVVSRGLGLQGIFAAAADSTRVFVSDSDRIFEIDRETGVPSLVTAGGLLVEPRGLSIDAAGRLLVAEYVAERVLRVDAETGAQTSILSTVLASPEYVLEDPIDGTLLVAAPEIEAPLGQGVHRINSTTGSVLESCTISPLNNPRQMALSDDGNTLWVADGPGPNAVFEIDLSVSLDTCSPVQIGGDVGEAWGLGLDPNGELIVASRTEGLFQYVDPGTGVQTVINESPDLASPHEIAVVPEPSAALALACGIALLFGLARRRGASS